MKRRAIFILKPASGLSIADRIQIQGDPFLEADKDELRVEKPGIDQKEYIWCIRLQEGWFNWESYLPT